MFFLCHTFNIRNAIIMNIFKINQIKSFSAGMAYEFEGDDRSELNLFMQHGLVAIGYDRNSANRICKFVIA